METLPHTLSDFQQLTSIDVSHNKLTHIPVELGKCTTLEKLLFQHNQISILPVELGHLSQLKHLDLSFNELTSFPTHVEISKDSIFHLKKLGDLDIGFNYLPAIPSFFNEMPTLVRVVSTGNRPRPTDSDKVIDFEKGQVESMSQKHQQKMRKSMGNGINEKEKKPAASEKDNSLNVC
jgi:hypothetical protein